MRAIYACPFVFFGVKGCKLGPLGSASTRRWAREGQESEHAGPL